MSATEHEGKAVVTNVEGRVHVTLPEGSYLDLTPEMAERLASRLLVEATRAKGKKPSGLMVVAAVGA
ncbi:hypothetical protein DEI99_005125 [Curtobacterium sp. MCLR17_036]|uniref:hypothetical protein n=1 Tax=Curtobacterium sp. MCLR17_036 TaxID=2175620 RepID=UPI0011B4DB40|nr:hypothetical protein [Curtobacterium sp. MCLR17_036]WIE65921.1 hypothetical protein DEI99_005125 [Curtobacterium sp. MCLR17_036]